MVLRQRKRAKGAGRGRSGPTSRRPVSRKQSGSGDNFDDSQHEEESDESDGDSSDGEGSSESNEQDIIEDMLDDAEMETFWVPPASGEADPAKDQRSNRCCMLVIFLFAASTFGLRLVGEDYEGGGKRGPAHTEDHYEALGISRAAKANDIKRAYKQLAMKWHPDKNPGCTACELRMSAVSQAYTTLGNPTRRAAYDRGLGDVDPLPSTASVTLDERFFREELLTNSDVWVLQTFDEADDACQHFAPIWERLAEECGSWARFGRVNARTDRAALRLLPVTPRLHPMVLIMSRGFQPAILPAKAHGSVSSLKNALARELPRPVTILGDRAAVAAFADSKCNSLKILIVSDKPQASPVLSRAGVQHRGHVMFAQARPDLVEIDGVTSQTSPRDGIQLIAFAPQGGSEPIGTWVLPKKGQAGFDALLRSILRSHAVPPLHRSNVKHLCQSASSARTFCVCFIDVAATEGPGSSAAGLMLNAAVVALGQSQEEALASRKLQADPGNGEDKEIHVQAVLLNMFHSETFTKLLRPLLNGSLAFVLDLDAHRFAPLPSNSTLLQDQLAQLHSSLLAGALSFRSLPLLNFRDLLRDVDESLWLWAWQRLKEASVVELILVNTLPLSVWILWHHLNLYRFMLLSFTAPIAVALCSGDFWWLLSEFWKRG